MRVFETIAHLPGSTPSADDVVLDDAEAVPFYAQPVAVVEKLDGINVTLFRHRGSVRARTKPKWKHALDGRVARALQLWVRQRQARLLEAIPPGFELYGEWLWHRISTPYDALPDELLGFGGRDVRGRPLPSDEAAAIFEAAGVPANPVIFEGTLGGPRALKRLLRRSQFGREPMEGLVVQLPSRDELRWAKWVQPHYVHVGPADLSGQKNTVCGPPDPLERASKRSSR